MRDRNHAVRRSVQKHMGSMGGHSCCASGTTVGVELFSCVRIYISRRSTTMTH